MKFNKKRIVIIAIAVYTVFTFTKQQITINNLNKQKHDIENKIEMVKKDNRRLTIDINSSKSLDYIEKVARDELGLVKKGETIFVNVNGNKK